ncbi:glycosyltransferase family 4 protein [Umezawaea tangerina]|uniref:Glycosyltransferase involved in cell wall biosynthesis n=1 Tax=Umezawaea tangerina TaxID=84725 RepID=A0A2T0TK92_9PSEU|nr:glycosyltransferase family 4 protein [Umezawaea tangerina]PRY46031.1 glycosyltransferase involved in cell wall biosynthesis [Umezawaea tangerina]
MRIVVVNNFFPPRVGGSAHVADTLSRYYAEQGHEVLVIAAGYRKAPAEEVRDGIRIVRLPSWTLPESRFSFNFDITFALRWGNRKRVFRLLDEFRPDVIHQHGQFFDLTWQSGLWARSRRIPSLLTLHTRLQSPMRFSHLVMRLLDALVVRPVLAHIRPTSVVAIDRIFHHYIRRRYAIPAERIEQVPVGVELHRFEELDREAERAALRARFDLGDGPVIASLGHVIPVRDRVALVEALPRVLASHPDAKVLVVGGVYYRAFLERARRLGVLHAVVCTGALPKSDIPGLLAGSDVEVHDLQGFGIGIASLEAMAAGTPTVLAERADYFSCARIANGEETLLVTPGDTDELAASINQLLDDPDLASDIGAAGRKWVHNNLDMPRICAANLDILRRLAVE